MSVASNMPAEIRCPKCPSVNVIFSKKRGMYLCEDCKHEFIPAKPAPFKRLFMSYGHDEHVSLALRLRDDLRSRGHVVWFDDDRLQPGHDWESFIEHGLEDLAADKRNAAVILLLTPRSVRRPDGYCLNEVARSLSRGLPIIPLMVVESEPPLSICRIQWLDMRECIPIHEKEALYRPRFERLLKAIEDDQLDFEGTQQRLLKALQPLEFDADILRDLSRFTGREWVFDAIQNWLKAPVSQRVFWISGGPGVGKTAISAVLSSRYLEVAALHLCKSGHMQKSDPRRVVTSIAYQLSTQLPDYQERLAMMDVEALVKDDASTIFDNLIVQPLTGLDQPSRAVVILVDALDEATRDDRNELAGFVASEFPKTPTWLRLIITSRPEKPVTDPLQGLDPFILDTETEANLADIRAYLCRELAPQLKNRQNGDSLLELIVEKSEGVFLYVERFCDDVHHGRISLDDPSRFPRGLGGVFWQFFERQFPDRRKFREEVRPVLRAVLAAREPLPVDILQVCFNWQDEELHDFTRALGSLFPVACEDGCQTIKPYHKSISDWLTDESKAGPYFVSAREGHRVLADYCWRNYRTDVKKMSQYALTHLPAHLLAACKWEEAKEAFLDICYIEGRVNSGQVFALAQDFATAADAWPADREEKQLLTLLNEALHRDLHFIARRPTTLFQCLWNSCWWYDSPQAEHQDKPSTGARGYGTGRLHEVLERWRDVKRRQVGGFLWIRSLLPPPVRLGTAQLLVLREHDKPVMGICFSPDGKRIASASADRTIRVWDAQLGKRERILRGHEGWVLSLQYSPDGMQLASSSNDRTVRLWSGNKDNARLVLSGHSEDVTCTAFAPNGRLLASGSDDGTVRLWSAETGETMRIFCTPDRSGVNSIAFCPDGLRLICACDSGAVYLWNHVSGMRRNLPGTGSLPSWSVAISPDGTRAASSDDAGVIRMWNMSALQAPTTWRKSATHVRAIRFTSDGQSLVAGDWHGRLIIFGVHDDQEVVTLVGHENGVSSLSVPALGNCVASGSWDSTIRIWDLASGRPQAQSDGHSDTVKSVQFIIKGKNHSLTSVSWNGERRFWFIPAHESELLLQKTTGSSGGDLHAPSTSSPDTGKLKSTSILTDESVTKSADPPEREGAGTMIIRAESSGLIETSFLDAAHGRPLAWFPMGMTSIVEHPSGLLWGGCCERHVYLLMLEREA